MNVSYICDDISLFFRERMAADNIVENIADVPNPSPPPAQPEPRKRRLNIPPRFRNHHHNNKPKISSVPPTSKRQPRLSVPNVAVVASQKRFSCSSNYGCCPFPYGCGCGVRSCGGNCGWIPWSGAVNVTYRPYTFVPYK